MLQSVPSLLRLRTAYLTLIGGTGRFVRVGLPYPKRASDAGILGRRERVAFPALLPAFIPAGSVSATVGACLAFLAIGWYAGRRVALRRTADELQWADPAPGSEGNHESPATTEVPSNEAAAPLRVEGLLEGIADPFFVVDADWIVDYANPAGRDFLVGGNPIGQRLWDVLPESMHEELKQGLVSIRDEGRYSTLEKYLDPPGRWFEIRGYPDGQGLGVYIQDISRRKWAEEDLQRTKESLTYAQELAHVGSWDYEGLSGRYTWSDETYRILGYQPGQFPATLEALLKVVHPDDRDRLIESIRLGPTGVATENGQAVPYEHRVVRESGEIRYLRGVVRAIAASGDRPSYVVGAVQDITERRKNEEALRAAIEDAQRADRAKSELLSRTSHELRTPLNAILGFGQLLELEVDGDENRESVGQILRAGTHLLKVVDEVLDIARAEVGTLTVDIVPLAPADIISEAVALMAPLARSKQVEIRPDFENFGEVGTLMADPTRLLQVLLNLVSNGIKYNRPGGVVEISCNRADDRVRLTIRDTGFGIEAATMQRLFLPFERGRANQGVEGTGLGLALSRSLVEAMNGRIWASTTVGEGSTFWMELPAGATQVAGASGDDAPGGDGWQGTTSTGPLVLYIEDNVSNYRLVERIFARHLPGAKIIQAAQGRLGIELANEHHPDLILLDLNLPDLSGTRVLGALQASDSTRGIPVVMVTGEAGEGQERKLVDMGATAYLTKPYQVKDFIDLLRPLLPGAQRSEPPA